MTHWTLEHNGIEKAFPPIPDSKLDVEGWGLTAPQFHFTTGNPGISTCEFQHPTDFDGDDLFDFEDPITIWADRTLSGAGTFTGGRKFFYGWITQTPRSCSVANERIGYTVSDPWYWLTQKVYTQRVKRVSAWDVDHPGDLAFATFQFVYISRLYLNQKIEGVGEVFTAKSSAWQIADALKRVIDDYIEERGAPAPFKFGTNSNPDDAGDIAEFPVINYPMDEVTGITCEEVIVRQLRLATCQIWFDYSTSPPTFHCKPYSALASLTLKLPPVATEDETTVEDCRLSARYDLQRPSVLINFETTITEVVNGASTFRSIVTDPATYTAVYPGRNIDDILYPPTQPNTNPTTGREFGALVQNFKLDGFLRSVVTATIEVEPVQASNPNDTIRYTWWSEHVDWLASPLLAAGTKQVQGVIRQSALPNKLISGPVPAWLGFITAKEKIKATAVYSKFFSDVPQALKAIGVAYEEISVTITTTDAEAGTYTKLITFDPGESIPEHLAKQIYDSLAILHYEGTIVTVEREAWNLVLGSRLNIDAGTGGIREDWKTMNALVQSVDIDAETGRTEISIGPPKVLNGSDLFELLRFNRFRRVYNAPIEDANQTGGDIDLTGETPLEGPLTSQMFAEWFSVTNRSVVEAGEEAGPSPPPPPPPPPNFYDVFITGKTADEDLLEEPIADGGSGYEDETGKAVVIIRAADSLASGDFRKVKLRKIPYCKDGDPSWFVIALVSEPFQDP